MHLLNTTTLKLSAFTSETDMKYAILSHRWLQFPDEEVLYQDMVNLEQCPKSAGVAKLRSFCSIASQMGYDWCWMDTCCIDKTSSAELSEAINSMYRWYRQADLCIAYLADVPQEKDDPNFEEAFRQSNWFMRCWTLQELLAPPADRFLFSNAGWQSLASKKELSVFVSSITGIDELVLQGKNKLSDYSIAQRMSWAAHRNATRIEDQAYSLMGIFDANMSMLYGEGERAFERLCETIIQYTDDETIFAWSIDETISRRSSGLLAPSPYYYKECHDMRFVRLYQRDDPFTLTSRGLTSTLMMTRPPIGPTRQIEKIQRAFLNAVSAGSGEEHCVAVYLYRISDQSADYARVLIGPDGQPVCDKFSSLDSRYPALWRRSCSEVSEWPCNPVKIYVRHRGHQQSYASSLRYCIDMSQLLAPRNYFAADPQLNPSENCHITVADGCQITAPPTHVSRPNGEPNGPLCNLWLDQSFHGIARVHFGIYGDFHNRGLLLLLYDLPDRGRTGETEGVSCLSREALEADISQFTLDYSDVYWSVVKPYDRVESDYGWFALKIRKGKSLIKCIRNRNKTSILGKVKVEYEFSIQVSTHNEGSVFWWSIEMR